MHSTVGFNAKWGDTKSNDRLRGSDKSLDVLAVEIDNHLKTLSLRFQYPLNGSTRELWSKDIATMGYLPQMVEEVCKSVPRLFQKHPSFSELHDLLRPYLAKKEPPQQELDVLTKKCFPSLREKFVGALGEDVLAKMLPIVIKEYHKDTFTFRLDSKDYELITLSCWLRSGFKDGRAILEELNKSNIQHDKKNNTYFIEPLRRYAKANDLI